MQYSKEYAGYAEYAEPAEWLTADGAYHCPVASIMAIFNNCMIVLKRRHKIESLCQVGHC